MTGILDFSFWHMPKFLAVCAIQSTVTCKTDTFSERRTISSAKRRSGMTPPLITAPLWLLSGAIAMTASRKMINKNRIRCKLQLQHGSLNYNSSKEGKQFQQSLLLNCYSVTNVDSVSSVPSLPSSSSVSFRFFVAHISWCVICRWALCWRGWRSSSPVFHLRG